MGRLSQIVVDIARIKVRVDFEVIQIEEDAEPYPALLGLGWAIDMGGVIELRKRSIIFEVDGARYVIHLDPAEEERYTRPKELREAEEKEALDCIYNITTQDQEWIDPNDDGMLCWEKESEYFSNAEDEIEN